MIPTRGVFIVHTVDGLVRPMDFRPPITITVHDVAMGPSIIHTYHLIQCIYIVGVWVCVFICRT